MERAHLNGDASINRPDPALLVEASLDILFVLDADGRVTYVNPAGEQVLGQRPGEYLGRSMLDYLHPDDAMLGISSMETIRTKTVGTPIEVRLTAPPPHWRWFEVIGRNCLDVPGINGIVLGARDLTERRMWEISANDVARFQQILHHAAAIVLSLDAEGTITGVNGALTRTLGVDPSIAIGRHLGDLAAPGHARPLHDAIARADATGSATVEIPMRSARGDHDVPVRFEIVDLLDDPVVHSFVVTGQDVSDLDAARRHLEHLATHDALTGLSNRSLLEERLTRLIEARRPLALLYVDLDRFKPVNDTHGHEVGDEVLQAVAGRLTASVGDGDLVARVGGDEFVVIALSIADRATAVSLAGRIESVLGEPYAVRVGSVCIGASVGAVVSWPTATAAALLAQADLAMYAAKTTRGV
ncbi:MAG TPA: diguanylate cyclase [Acidimicrobiales bacterium]|nr:diguanylate cyclase [Acidimicrobiales bacterium]